MRDIIPLPKHLVPYATAIGVVCLDWSYLESTANQFLYRLLQINDVKKFQTVCHNIDFRDRLAIIAQLCFIARPPNPADRWFNTLKWCLDKIDNDLRVRRNRFVHDKWILKPGDETPFVQRISARTGLKKQPSTGQYEHFTQEFGEETSTDVLSLANEIHQMGIRLTIIMFALEGEEDWEALLAAEAPLSLPKEGLGSAPR